MIGQGLASEEQVAFLDKRNGLLAQQIQFARLLNLLETSRNRIRIDRVRLVALQPQEHGFVAAMAASGRAQRTIEVALNAYRCRQESIALKA